MNFEDVIRNRYAVRNFSSQKVEEEDIKKILEAGRLAPTAKNNQPQKIYVVQSADGLSMIDEVSPCRYQAPVVLVVASDKSIAWSNGTDSSYEMDASIVATHMMLEATNIGLGSVWVKMFDQELLKEKLSLEESVEVICLIPIGYADCEPSPMHSSRKSIEEFVEYR